MHPVTAAMTLLLAHFGKKNALELYTRRTKLSHSLHLKLIFGPVNAFYFRTGFVKAEAGETNDAKMVSPSKVTRSYIRIGVSWTKKVVFC